MYRLDFTTKWQYWDFIDAKVKVWLHNWFICSYEFGPVWLNLNAWMNLSQTKRHCILLWSTHREAIYTTLFFLTGNAPSRFPILSFGDFFYNVLLVYNTCIHGIYYIVTLRLQMFFSTSLAMLSLVISEWQKCYQAIHTSLLHLLAHRIIWAQNYVPINNTTPSLMCGPSVVFYTSAARNDTPLTQTTKVLHSRNVLIISLQLFLAFLLSLFLVWYSPCITTTCCGPSCVYVSFSHPCTTLC